MQKYFSVSNKKYYLICWKIYLFTKIKKLIKYVSRIKKGDQNEKEKFSKQFHMYMYIYNYIYSYIAKINAKINGLYS